MIEFGHSTHVGLRREHNEDTYHADAELGLWLVADGMGGHEHGEVASALARDTLVREVGKGTELVRAIQLADEEIIRHSTRRSEALPMGTTIAAFACRKTAHTRSPGSATAASTSGPTRSSNFRRTTPTCRS